MKRRLILLNLLCILFPLGKYVNGQEDYVPCRAYIAISADNTRTLTSDNYQTELSFINSILSSMNHPERISFATGSVIPVLFGTTYSIQDFQSVVARSWQDTSLTFSLRRSLKTIYAATVMNTDFTVPTAAIVFISDTTAATNLDGAQKYADLLKELNVKVTLVLMGNRVTSSALTNITSHFVIWSDMIQPQPENWNTLSSSVYGCSDPISTTPSLSTPTGPTTTTVVPYIPCQSYIAFCIDNSNVLSSDFFQIQLNFLYSTVSTITHPERISIQQSFSALVSWNLYYNTQDVLNQITTITQNPNLPFNLRSVLKSLYGGLLNENNSTVPMAAVIFITDTTTPGSIDGAEQFANLIKNMGVKLTAILIGDKTNQSTVQNLFHNFIIWGNLDYSEPDNWESLASRAYGCPETPSITGGGSTTTGGSTSFRRTQPTAITSTTTSSSTTRAPPTPAFLCNSHIPFAVDISRTISSDQFTSMVNMILNPFLSIIHPIQIKPAMWMPYGSNAFPPKSPQNISDIINYIQLLKQGSEDKGIIKYALAALSVSNALSYSDNFPINTVIFTGSSLTDIEVPDTQSLVDSFVESGSTVTVVLMKDQVDLINYNKIRNLNIVQWDPNQDYIISHLENFFNCQ